MQLLRHLTELTRLRKPLAMAVGVFDGVHLGHRAVIREAVRQAHILKGNTVVLTFHPHPSKILHPKSTPPLLTSEQQDYELFFALDVDICVILDFTRELSLWPPRRFLDHLWHLVPSLRTVIVGPSWRFGHDREGNFQFLKSWAEGRGVRAIEVASASMDGQIISSTQIRKLVSEGDIAAANARLGRSYQILGRIVPGMGVGRDLGFPTANLDPESELIPARGVYAARALIDDSVFAAAVNIGCRPTVCSSDQTVVEAHLMDFDGNLYGHHMRLDFLARLRDEKKFKNTKALKAQIEADSEKAYHLAHQ